MSGFSQLYLIRHGQTAWSITGQHTGSTDIALTAQGEAQARELKAQLQSVDFSGVFSSPARRAQRTCELAGLGSKCETDAALREWQYGDYEGRTSADIERERPEWNLWRDGCPHGESPLEVTARADGVVQKLRAMRGNIALFLHGHFGAALAVRWLGLPLITGEHFPLRPASLSVLGAAANHPQTPALLLWNADTLAQGH